MVRQGRLVVALFLGALLATATPALAVDYRVRAGETLEEIAERYDVSINVLRRANGLNRTARVQAGDTLEIPEIGRRDRAHQNHTVERGQTLQRLAELFQVTVEALVQANGLRGSQVTPGDTLRIPTPPAPSSQPSQPARPVQPSAQPSGQPSVRITFQSGSAPRPATVPASASAAPRSVQPALAPATPSFAGINAAANAGGFNGLARAGSGAASRTQTGSINLPLEYTLGQGRQNHASEIAQVAFRLVALGFLDQPRSQFDRVFSDRLKLFQSVCSGSRRISGSGSLAPGDTTHQWLQAGNAPKWEMMPADGIGFENYEIKRQPNDDHDWGASWTADVIRGAGQAYQNSYRSQNPSAPLIEINDCSRRWGGDTPDHSGHETGLDIDVRLPTRSGSNGTTIGAGNYDRDAARAMLRAFRAQPNVSGIYFNDRTLINEGLCTYSNGHGDHFHVNVRPPAMSQGPVVNRGPQTGQNGGGANLAGLNDRSALWNADGLGQNNAGGGSSFGTQGNTGTAAPASTGQAQSAQFSQELQQPPMQLSGSDLEILARICKGEALQCDFEGKVAVLAVLLNRVRSSHWPNSVAGVAHQPLQFSCYNRNYRDQLYYGSIPAECWEAARAAAAGRDPTGGADHYFNPFIVNPGWQNRMRFTRQIGSTSRDCHKFYQAFTDHQREARPAGQ